VKGTTVDTKDLQGRQVVVHKALAVLPAGTAGRVVDLGQPEAVQSLFDDLGEIDHLVYTAAEPLALMPVATLDLDAARDFFTLRFFGDLSAPCRPRTYADRSR
jgi:hypothetical protein